MPVWLQILVAICTVLAFAGGVVVAVWKQTHVAKSIVDRPYPCHKLIDLEEKVKKQSEYLSSDRLRLESLEKSEAIIKTQLSNTAQDIKDIKAQTERIFMLLIEQKNE